MPTDGILGAHCGPNGNSAFPLKGQLETTYITLRDKGRAKTRIRYSSWQCSHKEFITVSRHSNISHLHAPAHCAIMGALGGATGCGSFGYSVSDYVRAVSLSPSPLVPNFPLNYF